MIKTFAKAHARKMLIPFSNTHIFLLTTCVLTSYVYHGAALSS